MKRRATIHSVDAQQACAYIPQLHPDMHKYSRGHVFVVAGSSAFPGAAVLAAQAAHCAGAGYVSAYVPDRAQKALLARYPSLVLADQDNFLQTNLKYAVHRPAALLIGPGFNLEEREKELLMKASESDVPLVIDGSALVLLAKRKEIAHEIRERVFPTVLTPHYAEAIALLKAMPTFFVKHGLDALCDASELIDDISQKQLWPDVCQYVSDRFQAICVLKGPDAYIATPSIDFNNKAPLHCVTNGTPALAKAGSGDVLSGIIAAFMSFSLPENASYEQMQARVSSAVWCHAQAGVHAAKQTHELSVTPESLIDFLYLVYNECK